MQPLQLSHKGFKAYDIRGVVGAEVNEDLAYRVGRAYAALYHPQAMCVGYDIRPSSPAIAKAVMRGLMDGGADVMDIGLCGTEMMYFATFHYGLSGGIMITASHNPSNYNGLKLVREGGIPVSADTGLKDIEALAFSGDFPEAEKKGKTFARQILQDYIDCILSFVDVTKMKPLHIVVDAGNGCANIAFAELKKHLPFTFTELYMEPDGSFPHGVPNPMLEECQKPLKEKVLEEKADLGIAWDGDFDRCFFIGTLGDQRDLRTGGNAHGKHAKKALRIDLAIVRLDPDAGAEFICLLNEISSLLIVKSRFTLYDRFFCVHACHSFKVTIPRTVCLP